MRGVGWAVCYLNPYNGRLTNHWITLHETGNVAGFVPVLAGHGCVGACPHSGLQSHRTRLLHRGLFPQYQLEDR